MISTQLSIALLGIPAIALSQDRRQSWRRWSCVLGLASQPAWFYETATAHQWGMFAMSIACAAAWSVGVWANWIKRGGV